MKTTYDFLREKIQTIRPTFSYNGETKLPFLLRSPVLGEKESFEVPHVKMKREDAE